MSKAIKPRHKNLKKMNTFEITLKGNVLLHQDHQGNNPNSMSYAYFAFAKYALENALMGDASQIFWLNGRQEWTLEELNLIANYMGLDEFFISLGNNTGGAEFKDNQDILKCLSPWTYNKVGIASFPNGSIIELQRIKYSGIIEVCPPCQPIGEEYVYFYTFDGEGNCIESKELIE